MFSLLLFACLVGQALSSPIDKLEYNLRNEDLTNEVNGPNIRNNFRYPYEPTYWPTTSEPTTSEPTTSEPTTSEPTTSEPTYSTTDNNTTPNPTTRLTTTTTSTTTTEEPETTCHDKMFSCASCSEAQVCSKIGEHWKSVSVTQCSEDTPFCNSKSGSCSSEPDENCGKADKEFICLSSGQFPDSKNCSIYHLCNEDMAATTYWCPRGETYNADDERCESSKSTQCESIDCIHKNGVKVPLGNSHFFGVCIAGNVKAVARCEGDYKLNVTSQICEAKCEKPGLMADFYDNTMYYKCSSLVLTDNSPIFWLREHLSCPTGQQFTPESFMCVPKKLNLFKK